MKKSRIIEYTSLMMIFLLLSAYSFYVAAHTTVRTVQSTDWLTGKGEYKFDTINTAYHHLVTNFPLTTLDNRIADQVTVEGYKSARYFLSVQQHNDTLYVRTRDIETRSRLADHKVNGEFAIIANIGAKNLKSITVEAGGNIFHDADPIAANNKGETFFEPAKTEQFTMNQDILDVYLKEGSDLTLLLNVGELNIYTYGNNAGIIKLLGQSRVVNFKRVEGRINSTATINADSIFIYQNKDEPLVNSGSISVKPKDYLFVELYSDMDVVYKGNPTIFKIETGYGRLINNNLIRLERENNQNIGVIPVQTSPLFTEESIEFLAPKKDINELMNYD